MYKLYEKLEKNGLVKKTIENIYATGRRLDWKTPVPPQLTAKFDFIEKKDPSITPSSQSQVTPSSPPQSTSTVITPPSQQQHPSTTSTNEGSGKKNNGSKNKKGKK